MDLSTQLIPLSEGREKDLLAPVAPPGPSAVSTGQVESNSGAADDAELIAIWLSAKTSAATRRAYASALHKFQAACSKPLARLTVSDILQYKERLLIGDGTGRKAPASATVNLALLAVKSLLSSAQETGYLRYNVGAAVLYTCGVRRAEAAGLRWCDLQPRPEAGQVTVFGERRQEPRGTRAGRAVERSAGAARRILF